jgi:hypothetical protein
MPIQQVPRLIRDLYKVVKELNLLFPGRPFTPDGHLVGSIGEVVAAYVYDLDLAPCSTPSFDAHTKNGRKKVEIKLTSGNQISVSEQDIYADVLIVMKLVDGVRFEEVYAGSFPEPLVRQKRISKRRVASLRITELRKLNCHELSSVRLADLNQLFGELT